MVDDRELELLLKRIYDARPRKYFESIDSHRDGTKFTLIFLYESEKAVSAGDISRELNVSTARVAKIIKTMLEKDLIVKEDDKNDARKVRISLSEHGYKTAREHMEKMKIFLRYMIEKIGIDKLNIFLDISDDIKGAIEEMVQEGCLGCESCTKRKQQ